MDESVQMLIIFIASVMAAGGFIGVIFVNIQSMGDVTLSKGSEFQKTMISDITILHVNDTKDYIFIKNTGKRNMYHNDTLIQIDGNFTDYRSAVIMTSSSSTWKPGDVVRFHVVLDMSVLDDGWHIAKAINGKTKSNSYKFEKE